MLTAAWNDENIVAIFNGGNLQDRLKQKEYMKDYFRQRLSAAKKNEVMTHEKKTEKQLQKNRSERQRTVSVNIPF